MAETWQFFVAENCLVPALLPRESFTCTCLTRWDLVNITTFHSRPQLRGVVNDDHSCVQSSNKDSNHYLTLPTYDLKLNGFLFLCMFSN